MPDSTSKGLTVGKYAETISKLLPVWHGLDIAEGILGAEYARIEEVRQVKKSAASLIEHLVQVVESNKHPDKVYLPVQTWRKLAQ